MNEQTALREVEALEPDRLPASRDPAALIRAMQSTAQKIPAVFISPRAMDKLSTTRFGCMLVQCIDDDAAKCEAYKHAMLNNCYTAFIEMIDGECFGVLVDGPKLNALARQPSERPRLEIAEPLFTARFLSGLFDPSYPSINYQLIDIRERLPAWPHV